MNADTFRRTAAWLAVHTTLTPAEADLALAHYGGRPPDEEEGQWIFPWKDTIHRVPAGPQWPPVLA